MANKLKERPQHWIEVTDKNADDIKDIKNDINDIKNNHLAHLEKDMERQTKQIEKIDSRIWWVLGLLVAALVISAIKSGIAM